MHDELKSLAHSLPCDHVSLYLSMKGKTKYADRLSGGVVTTYYRVGRVGGRGLGGVCDHIN